ncbi:DUF6221 family protein [Streptomyces sp. NPDC057136]|uniref:DUF6221 family protein n=1 Tax=Streptomyces sp. NPDC057136 TaxID=3346029 RepID=UPI00362D0674
MDDLVQFLRDRLDEGEAVARAATQGDWVWSREFVTPPGYHHRTIGPLEPGDAAHIARHDPARVLREVEAKREILRWHSTPHTVVDGFCADEGGPCTHRGEAECTLCGGTGCPTLRLLALPYADHPDYQETWRP